MEIKFDDIYFGPASGYGRWFSSKEDLPIGTVRHIRGMLFTVCRRSEIESGFFGWKTAVSWVPVDEKENTPEGWRKFYAGLL